MRVSDSVSVTMWTVDRTGLREAVELLADRERRVEHRDADRAAERPVDDVGTALLALVEDDRGVVARGLGVLGLDDEVAGATLDQRDLGLGGRRGCEVGRLTARVRRAGRRAGRDDDVVRRHHVTGHVAGAGVLHRLEVRAIDVGPSLVGAVRSKVGSDSSLKNGNVNG